MLLPLLGTCALVGPFHGSEWEPVRGLLSQDGSCGDLRCYGNLLVLCLFVIWQVRHCWHHVNKIHPRWRKAIKVPPQERAVSFRRHAPEFCNSLGELRDLDFHVQRWIQKQRWGYQRSLQESWVQCLLSSQRRCQGPPWDAYILGSTSFSSTCLIPRDSSWEAWEVSWGLSDGHTHLIREPLPLDLEMCQRMEQLLVHSSEELAPDSGMRSHPTSGSLSTSLPNLSSAQRLQFCPREFPSVPPEQQQEMPTWRSWGCLKEAWATEREQQTADRGEERREFQAPRWGNQRQRRKEDTREPQAPGSQPPIDFGMEDDTASEILEWGDQRLVLNETDEEVLTPGGENQGRMEGENRAQVQERAKRNQREAGENPTETQAYSEENQEQLRCKTDAETQTPKWGNQDGGSGEDATEIQAFERKNKKEATGEGQGDTQTQGLGKQGQTTSKNGEEFQIPEREQQDQQRGNIQAEERRKQDQFGGEDAVHFQMAGRQILGEGKEECLKTQALEWGKQKWVGRETVPEIQTPRWENQIQGQKKKARGKNEMKLRLDIPVGWGNQHPGKGKEAGASPTCWRRKWKEIREEDWVMIQAPCWGTQRIVASEIDREFDTSCWGDQGQMAAEIWASEMRNQKEGGGEGGAESWSPEVDNQGQLSGEAAVAIQPPVRSLFGTVSEGQLVDKNGSDMQVSRKGSLRGVKCEETQRFGEENQGQLRSEMNGKIHTSKWKNKAPVRSKDGANTQAFEAENWRKLTINMNGEVHLSGWEKEEQTECDNSVKLQVPENRSQREAGGENGIETQAPRKENQSQLGSDGDGNACLSEWKNQEQMRGKNRTEIQSPEKRHQREAGGEDGVETQRSEREKQEQLDGEINEDSSSPRMRNCLQAGGEDQASENQASEKGNQREVGSEDNTKIQKLGEENQTTSLSKVNGPEIWAPGEENQIPLRSDGDRDAQLSEWKNQELMGSGNAADIPIKGKRNLRGSGVDDGSEIQASGGVNQGELRSEINREIQTEGQGDQNKVSDKDATEIWDVGSERKSGAEDAGVPTDRKKNQVREKDAAKENLKADCAGSEGRKPSLAQHTALTSSGYETTEGGQAVPMDTLASAPGPEMKHLPQQDEVLLLVNGEEERLAIWGPVPAREHESQRGGRNDKDVVLGKASSLTPSVATLSLPSVCPSLQCGPAPQGATTFPGTPTALTDLPKRPVLKKSQRLVLESLMRRKIAHLKWGLPQRILESYLLLNFLGPCPLPNAGLRLPGLYTDHKFQGQQKRLCEAQGSRPGPKPPKKPPRVNAPGIKSPKLPTQARALEKCGPYLTEPLGGPIHLEKLRTTRPPGGARERKATQGETGFWVPRNPRPEAESGSWCSGEGAEESSSETVKGRKMVRPGVSQMAERAPSRVRTSGSRTGHHNQRKERPLWAVPEPPRSKLQEPTYWRRGNLEPMAAGGDGQQSSSSSTDHSSFKGSLRSAAVRLSMTLLNKISWSSQPAKPQRSVPDLNLQNPAPSRLPKAGDPHTEQGSIDVSTSSKRHLRSPRHCVVGAHLPDPGGPQSQEAPWNPNRAPWSPSTPPKFVFMKHLRSFLLQLGFKK